VTSGSVQVRIAGGAWTPNDLPLPGVAPLTMPGTFTITVVLP
jgi:hypothetical protein